MEWSIRWEVKMLRHILKFICLSIIVAYASSANAYLTDPMLMPEEPHAGEPVSFAITSGFCDFLLGTVETHQDGRIIHAVMDGVRSDAICAYPSVEHVFEIGSFPAGSYLLQIDLSYFHAGAPNDITVETIATISFRVTPAAGAAATPVPVFNLAGLAGLALLLTALSVATLRQRLR